MTFAIIKTGSKQYKVQEGTILKVEKLNVTEGDKITFDNVLGFGEGKDFKIGTPTIDGVTVEGTVEAQGKDEKVIVFKKKRRHNYRRKKGHRQEITIVKITGITSGGKKAAAPKKAEAKPAAKPAAKKEAAPKAEAKLSDVASKLSVKASKAEADDLKKISGVGPVLEKKLNEAGITTFEQVAKMNKADIALVEESLSFPGRIERDDWLVQAKELAKDA